MYKSVLSVVAVPMSQEIANQAGLGEEFLDYLATLDSDGNDFCRAIEYHCPECFLTEFTDSVVGTSTNLKVGQTYLCWEGVPFHDKEPQEVLKFFGWTKAAIRGSYTKKL